MTIIPHAYTLKEGGDWLAFPTHISISKRILKFFRKDLRTVCFPKGLIVHSILIKSRFGPLIRWDCVNGYTGWASSLNQINKPDRQGWLNKLKLKQGINYHG